MERGKQKDNCIETFEEMMYYYTDSYTYYSYSFSTNPEFNNRINSWISSKELAEIFIPVIEKYYFENPDMEYEEQWRLDQLYSVLQKI